MKKHSLLIVAMALMCGLSSCGGGSNSSTSGGKKFNPQDRTTSKLSDEERAAAIAKKKSEMSVDPYAMLTTNSVKLTVLPPQPAGDITEEMAELIGVKMLQTISANGIGGLNTVPGFALGASIIPGERKVTGTAPQKMVVTYTLSYKVLNMVTGDVYAASEEEIAGAGSSFPEAVRSAVKSIKNTTSMSRMLSEGSKKIIEWFDTNLPTFQSQVDAAYQKGDYALALALVESVPQASTKAFEYAQGRHNDILTKFQANVAATELTLMKQAMASSPSELSTEVYAHMLMLPKNSPEYKQAEQMLGKYEQEVFKAQGAKLQREIAKSEADAQRAHELELANIEAEKMKAKYQADASEESYKKQLDVQRGFWGNLGARLIGAIDKVGADAEVK